MVLINLMDWKNDRIEVACNISAYYSTNYVFTYIHMPKASCCTSEMQNFKTREINNRGDFFFIACLLASYIRPRNGPWNLDFFIRSPRS